MKSTIVWFGIISFITVIGLSMSACDLENNNALNGNGGSGGTGGGISTATELTLNTWSGQRSIGAGVENWFKFTATSENQYIHLERITMTSNTGRIQLYRSANDPVGSFWFTSIESQSLSITSGTVYYIKVWEASGTYRISFTDSSLNPNRLAAMNSAPTLTLNTWSEQRTLSGGGEHWFKFTATSENQYIHHKLYQTYASATMNIRLYRGADDPVGNAWSSSLAGYHNVTITSGEVYYIRLWSQITGYDGPYRIGLNTTITPPDI